MVGANAAKRRAFAFAAPSGSGKSTATRFLREGFEASGLRVDVVKLAEPLYRLQREFYRYTGREIDLYAQDQPLLESIAAHLRGLSPRALVDYFLLRFEASDADVVINDDLRDPHVDWPTMRQAGFRVVGIAIDERTRRERLSRRGNLATSTNSRASREVLLIRPDIVLDNNGSLQDLERVAAAVVRGELR